MRFAFSEDQLAFQVAVRELLARECPPAVVRAAWVDERASDGVWHKLAAQGVLGLRVASDLGGLGGDELDLVLLLEEAGRAALPGAFAETVAIGAPLL